MKLRQLRDSLPAVMICDACVLLLPDYCSAMWQEVWENTARSVQWILELYNTMQLIYSRPPRMPRAELMKRDELDALNETSGDMVTYHSGA